MGFINKHGGIMLGDIKKVGLGFVALLTLGAAYSLGFFTEVTGGQSLWSIIASN
jgi:hypothetical protein